MLKPLQNFLTNPNPTLPEAVSFLRTAFVLIFMAQSVVAALLMGALRLVAGSGSASALLSQILVVFSLLQIPVGVLLALGMSRAGGKGAALSGVIMAGVMLATPVWFLTFGFLVGAAPLYLAILLAIVVNAYAAGFLLCNYLAKLALVAPKNEESNVVDSSTVASSPSTEQHSNPVSGL